MAMVVRAEAIRVLCNGARVSDQQCPADVLFPAQHHSLDLACICMRVCLPQLGDMEFEEIDNEKVLNLDAMIFQDGGGVGVGCFQV